MRQLPQLHEQLQDIHSLQVKPGDVITFKESSVKKMAFSELIRASKTHWGGGFELLARLQSEGNEIQLRLTCLLFANIWLT